MTVNETIIKGIENMAPEALELLLELAQIPAPSNTRSSAQNFV